MFGQQQKNQPWNAHLDQPRKVTGMALLHPGDALFVILLKQNALSSVIYILCFRFFFGFSSLVSARVTCVGWSNQCRGPSLRTSPHVWHHRARLDHIGPKPSPCSLWGISWPFFGPLLSARLVCFSESVNLRLQKKTWASTGLWMLLQTNFK